MSCFSILPPTISPTMENTTASVNLCSNKSLFLISLCFFFLLVPIACDSPPVYNPTENFAIDCGSRQTSDVKSGTKSRKWFGDTDSGLSFLELLNSNSSRTSSALRPPLDSDEVPFGTARLSRSEFTYVLNVSAGQKFIRLHFYPNVYQEFDPSKAFFSVKANQYILVRNFSASLTATFLRQQTVTKEFCINVDTDQRLNLTFTPSTTPSDAYAFINGIEIVSMPTNLYYTSAKSPGFTFINQNAPFRVENITALENVYRLNVGGEAIGQLDDTGMFRKWSPDQGYNSNVGALPVDLTINLNFLKIANYAAPNRIYQTARTMGNDAAENQRYNLTWSLPVDSGFIYMVRLHFCEFQKEVTKSGDREFQIYIANYTAETMADVITWSGGNGVPYFKDYAVRMNLEKGGTQNLTIALHPGSETRTRYLDAILNGLEVFKLTDSSNTLAGPNPDIAFPPPPASVSGIQPAKSKSKRRTAAIVGGVLSGVVALALLGFLILRQQKTSKDSSSSSKGPLWRTPFLYTAMRTTNGGSSHLPSNLCRHFSLSEIQTTTNNFDSEFIIGHGGFGDVYKGYVDDGATPVAIKRLKQGSQQGAHEFRTEIEMLSQLRHVHLVSLIGYCNDGHEMILVYDYMSRGSLRDHLYNTDNPSLSWKQRLNICIGAARGLQYLHTGAKFTIIHRDVKTANILLDDKWVAKFSDFGLSKSNPDDVPNTPISTRVKGSLGYLDPEYMRRQQLTVKSDVYSFGVVLLEVLSARPPLNKMLAKDEINLVAWAKQCYLNGTIDQIVDPYLIGQITPKCLQKFAEIGVSCLHDEGIQRPSMSDVVWSLEFALQLQESADTGINLPQDDEMAVKDEKTKVEKFEFDTSREHVSSGEVMMTSSGTGTVFTSGDSDSNKLPPGAVFSEILNPRGR